MTVDVPSGRLACMARLDPTVAGRRGALPERAGVRAGPRRRRSRRPRGRSAVDVRYGGAFYASVDVRALDLDVSPAQPARADRAPARAPPGARRRARRGPPRRPGAAGIYGVIFWQAEPGPRTGADRLTQRNVTVFADGEVDRSPCGSGTSARLALLPRRRRLGPDVGARSAIERSSTPRSSAGSSARARTSVVGPR